MSPVTRHSFKGTHSLRPHTHPTASAAHHSNTPKRRADPPPPHTHTHTHTPEVPRYSSCLAGTQPGQCAGGGQQGRHPWRVCCSSQAPRTRGRLSPGDSRARRQQGCWRSLHKRQPGWRRIQLGSKNLPWHAQHHPLTHTRFAHRLHVPTGTQRPVTSGPLWTGGKSVTCSARSIALFTPQPVCAPKAACRAGQLDTAKAVEATGAGGSGVSGGVGWAHRKFAC